MVELLLIFCGLSALVVIAAVFLANSADQIASATSLGHSMAGLVLLAGATSLPELLVGYTGVSIGAIDLTVGELLGSCLLNLLILAIMDLVTRTRGRMLSRLAAAHALSAAVCILLAAVVMLGLLITSDFRFLRLGFGTWVIFFVYLACMRLIYNDQQVPADEPAIEMAPHTKSLVSAILIYLASGAVILFAAPELAHVANELSEKTGLGQTFFGTVFVALITSLPEVVATYTAIRLGAFDMAVGNIFGSNCINIFILALVDFASPDPILASASLTHIVTAVSIVIITAVAVIGLLYRAEKRIMFLEPDAIVIILLVFGALYLVYDPPVIAVR
ncbi:sodium:calcium antiporter [Thalassoglobus sp. JC818]|uniref:sodium:calcium antiporter n=1 Tax=Thalassoglobus sp. JC818 TaxID=3232136 RepID=UPI003459AC88